MPSGGWVTTHQDITEATRAEARITYLARHDWLTELPNRLQFRDVARRRADQRQLQQQQDRADLDRPRSIQGRQRHARSSGRRRIAQGGVRAAARLRAQDRHCRAARRRRIRHHPVRHGRPARPGRARRARLIESLLASRSGSATTRSRSAPASASPLRPITERTPTRCSRTPTWRSIARNPTAAAYYRFFEEAMDAKMRDRRALETELTQGAGERGIRGRSISRW